MPRNHFAMSVTLVGLLLPMAAFGVDGVTLIDQNKALAGNITLGDAPGFPVTISQSGSYRLDSNLVVPEGSEAIEITSPNVTIDLNGFSILTAGATSFSTATAGIAFKPVPTFLGPPTQSSGITIRNGLISGFTIPIRPLLYGSTLWTLDSLVLVTGLGPDSATGMQFGDYTRLSHVTALRLDILVSCPSTVTDTVARSIGRDFSNPVSAGACTFANNATTF